MAWKLLGEPRPYEATWTGGEATAGWAWEVEDQGVRRVINAEIADSAREAYAFEDAEAAVRDVLPEVDPPARLVLTNHGIERG
jgi:hypothetical protein